MSFLGRIFGRPLDASYQGAMDAFNAGAFERALQEFEHVLELTHDSSDPLHSLSRFYAAEAAHHVGYVQLERGETPAALAHFRRALAWNRSFPALHAHLALACTELGAHAEARGHADEALAQNPQDVEVRLLCALLDALQVRDDASERELRRALQAVLDSGLSDPMRRVLATYATSLPLLQPVLR